MALEDRASMEMEVGTRVPEWENWKTVGGGEEDRRGEGRGGEGRGEEKEKEDLFLYLVQAFFS